MGAAIISSRNWLDEPGVTITSLLGTWERPLSEIKKPWGRGLARAVNLGVGRAGFRIDLGEERQIVTIGAIGCSSTFYELQVRMSGTSPGGTEVLNDVTSSYSPDWNLPFGAHAWLHRSGLSAWAGRYLDVYISQFDFDGPIDIRRLWIGGGTIVAGGVQRPWDLDFVDGSLTERTARGGVFVDSLGRWRRIRCSVQRRSQLTMTGGSSALGVHGELLRAGRDREIVVIPRINDGTGEALRRRYLQTIYGQLTEWTPAEFVAGNLVSIESFVVEEAPMPALS